MSDKEKKFILFVIDIYIDYAQELEVNTVEEHKKIIRELNKIKEKL